jgi:hypothetical protein
MGEIVSVFTLQGQVIGEKVDRMEYLPLGVKLRNPVLIINQGPSVSFFAMTQFVDEDEVLILNDKLVFDGTYTPKSKLQDEYRRMFGAGIEIAQQLPPSRIALS